MKIVAKLLEDVHVVTDLASSSVLREGAVALELLILVASLVFEEDSLPIA